MNTNDFGCPEVANGPIAGKVTSLRKRPWPSRKTCVSVFRAIWFPSASVWFVSETATALNGTPVTTFPPCIPSKPSNSMRSPIMPASGPRTCSIAICGGGGSGAASCALAIPGLNVKIPLSTILMHILRFIIPSPLLSRTAASFLPRRFQRFPLSTGSAESSNHSIGRLRHRGPLFSLFPRTPSPPSFCTPPELDDHRPCNHYRGSLTASGNPSFPTRRSTWIQSLARSSLTGNPNAPSAPRCMRTRNISASPVSAAKAPGRNVKPLISLSAISVSASAASDCRTAAALCAGLSWFAMALELFAGGFTALCGDVRWFAVSSLRQFLQLTAPASTAAAASAHAATTAARRAFNVTCCVRNSWRKRISTRAGACTMAVSSANARSSTPAACQESCNAAQREQVPACSFAAARSTSLNDASRSASNPIASNSSHVISCFLCITQNPSSCRARAPRHAAKYFQFGHQQGATAMQPRTNRANRASGHLRGFLVTHFFQLTKHYSFAKLHRQFLNCGPHLLH